MAEILIKAVDATHADPIKDQRGCYKRGMPVCVMPDGHTWGAAERLPAFVVLKLPGITVERVQAFLHPLVDAEGEVVRRRLWQIAWADLPPAARTKILASGALTIGQGGDYTWSQFRNYLRRADTKAAAPATL